MRTWHSLEAPQKEFQGGVVTIGNFDGLHLGHQALIQVGLNLGKPLILMTFDPHPLKVLRPDGPTRGFSHVPTWSSGYLNMAWTCL